MSRVLGMHHAIAFLVAMALVAGIYFGGETLLEPGHPLYEFLYNRSGFQWVTIGLFCWAACVLFLRCWRLPDEWAAVRWLKKNLPEARGPLSAKEATALAETVEAAGTTRRRGRARLMVHELLRFRCDHSSQDTRVKADEIAKRQRNSISAGYALVWFVAGVLPLVGLMGTVWGLSDGISEVTGLNGQAASLEVVVDRLEAFARCLAIAFDTTKLALLCFLPLLFMALLVSKADEGLFARAHQLIQQRLADRLPARSPSSDQDGAGNLTQSLVEGLASALTAATADAVASISQAANESFGQIAQLIQQHLKECREDARVSTVEEARHVLSGLIGEHRDHLQARIEEWRREAGELLTRPRMIQITERPVIKGDGHEPR